MNSESYQFAEFILSPAKRTLFHENAEVRLRDKDFDVLLFLLENAHKLCSFDEIIQTVWGGIHVENSSVEKAVANIRKTLADDPRKPRFIKTVRTKGYLFFGDVRKIRGGAVEESSGQVRNSQAEPVETIGLSREMRQGRNRLPGKILWCFGVLLLAVLGLFLWQGVGIRTNVRGSAVFADDFSGGVINPARWKILGKSVKPVGGTVKLSVDETDNPGILRSEFFSVDSIKTITVESRVRVTFSQNMKDKVYFGGLFGFIPKTADHESVEVGDEKASKFFGVRYMNYDSSESYRDPSGREYQDIKTEGFFLVRNGGRPNTKAEYAEGKISERMAPVWGEWFEQKIIYNPADGLMTYFIDGEQRGEFNVGPLQAKNNQIKFEIIPWGWWVNHSMEIDYVRVIQ